MAREKKANQKKNNGANIGYEAELWRMADALRGSMDAAEYKHVVLGLIFLKYISDAFEEQHAKLEAQKSQGADPEDQDEYRTLNIFRVPPEARWSYLKVCIAPFDGTTRTTAFVLFPRAKEDFAFATLLLHHPDTIDYATRHSTGSTIPYAVWSNSLEEMPVIVPPSEVRSAFDGVVRPMLDRIPKPHFQNRTLAALRETRLPKLISGELQVKDVSV